MGERRRKEGRPREKGRKQSRSGRAKRYIVLTGDWQLEADKEHYLIMGGGGGGGGARC